MYKFIPLFRPFPPWGNSRIPSTQKCSKLKEYRKFDGYNNFSVFQACENFIFNISKCSEQRGKSVKSYW